MFYVNERNFVYLNFTYFLLNQQIRLARLILAILFMQIITTKRTLPEQTTLQSAASSSLAKKLQTEELILSLTFLIKQKIELRRRIRIRLFCYFDKNARILEPQICCFLKLRLSEKSFRISHERRKGQGFFLRTKNKQILF